MLSANSDSLTTSIPIWIPFTPFWIAVTRLLTLCLNKTGDSGHTCLVPDLRGIFTAEYDVSCGFVIYSLYYVEAILYSYWLNIINNKFSLNPFVTLSFIM